MAIQHVTALIEQAMRHSDHYSLAGRLPPQDWSEASTSWRPVSQGRSRQHAARRSHPVSPFVQKLISDAICKQIDVSIRLAHRLDGYIGGQLFSHDEALIANKVAQLQQLGISFRPPLAVLQKQSLTEVNRMRRLERILNKEGPKKAIPLVQSFRLLCNVVPIK